MGRFTCLDILFSSFFDFGTGWIIVAMWPLDWMYPPLLWLPKFNYPWVVASPWLGNGVGGGGTSYAIDPGVPACLYPMASYCFKNF
jgi:hypothetical protein